MLVMIRAMTGATSGLYFFVLVVLLLRIVWHCSTLFKMASSEKVTFLFATCACVYSVGRATLRLLLLMGNCGLETDEWSVTTVLLSTIIPGGAATPSIEPALAACSGATSVGGDQLRSPTLVSLTRS